MADQKFRPILFSTEMVVALQEVRKTQTRRIVKLQPENTRAKEQNIKEVREYFTGVPEHGLAYYWMDRGSWNSSEPFKCPYGLAGDILWVRETFCERKDGSFIYKAGWKFCDDAGWKPSIHMPKEAARLFLKIKNIRVERLQEINEDGAIAEGIVEYEDGMFKNYFTQRGLRERDGVECMLPKASFISLWSSINGKDSWKSNPWVWVIEFELVDKPENFGRTEV